MGFEDILKGVVQEYEVILQARTKDNDILTFDTADIEAYQQTVAGIHKRVLGSDPEFFDKGLFQMCHIPFPEGDVLYYGVDNVPLRGGSPHICLHYKYTSVNPCASEDCVIDNVCLTFFPGLWPTPRTKTEEMWEEQGLNLISRSEHGFIGILPIKYSGNFYPTHDELSRVGIKANLLLPNNDPHIFTIKVSPKVLGKGSLTAFFKHVQYDWLEQLVVG